MALNVLCLENNEYAFPGQLNIISSDSLSGHIKQAISAKCYSEVKYKL